MIPLGIPNPVDIITNAAGGWAWDKVTAGIAQWILDAVSTVLGGIAGFFGSAARADVTDAWFSGAGSPYATVRNLAGVLMVGFLLAGIVQGLAANDVSGMIRRVAVDAPTAVLGMAATTVIVDTMLDLTDSLSNTIVGGSSGQAMRFLGGFGAAANTATSGFAGAVVGIVIVVAGGLIWIELLVRSSLTYLLVALSPLAFATIVWPALRGTLKRLFELLVAVVLSKLVIAIALAVGVSALGGAGTAAAPAAGLGEQVGEGLGTLMIGAGIIALAACSPFVLLRLFPLAESAMAAQGISRSPLRGANSTMGTVYYASSLKRLGGGGSGGGAGGPTPEGPPPSGGPSPTDAATSTAGSAGAGAGATGDSAAAAGAATGPAAPVAIPVLAGAAAARSAASTAKDTATSAAGSASSLGGASSDPGPSGGRTSNEPPPRDPTEPFPGGAT